MNPKYKIGLYAALVITAAIFAALFYSSYKIANKEPVSNDVSPSELSSDLSNSVTAATNLSTNTIPLTNQPGTNQSATVTNEVETNVVARPEITTATPQIARPATTGRSRMVGYFVAFLGFALILGLLIARDISEYFGNRSVEFMFNDEGTGIKNPEYEEAEQQWANGQHLDAIRMMRDYLTRNPREQYVALRIAEIYEKDLKNHLAAALEYEEILKHKLPPDRWGWAAIHLCNLYSKLGKTDNAVVLLRRIATEYADTPAAEKARKRLATFETVGEEALGGDLPDSIETLPPKPRKLKWNLLQIFRRAFVQKNKIIQRNSPALA